MKYLIFEDFSGRPAPVLFPDRIEFDEMREQIPYARLLGAGRVRFPTAGCLPACEEAANELGLKPGANDAQVIAAYCTGRAEEAQD